MDPATPADPMVVLLATAWGPVHGGINSFNVELARSLGVMPARAYQLACVVPQANAGDREDAALHGVRLLEAHEELGGLPASVADAVAQQLALGDGSRVVWVGHDDKTGPLALALRRRCASSRVVLFHHMAFGAYQDFKKGNSADAAARRNAQRDLFAQADLCVAVGPMLRDQLRDLLSATARAPAVEMIVPGLAEPDPDAVRLLARAPHNFTAFIGGRLGSEDERIKQALLAVRGYGRAVREAFTSIDADHPIRRAPTLRMRGVPTRQHQQVRQVVEAESGQVINCDLEEYVTDRTAYFGDLAASSVALMPSWHEGFGLTAWEAIACQVPVIVGEQSGVYRLLYGHCLGEGIGRSVYTVNVRGQRPTSADEAAHAEADVADVARAILSIGARAKDSKSDAIQLAINLRRAHGFTWAACANDLVGLLQSALSWPLTTLPTTRGSRYSTIPSSASSDQTDQQVPAFLRVPKATKWQPELGLTPSALLLARDRIVQFHPARGPQVGAWTTSLQSSELPRLSIRLVCGPGGIGKTRSALELVDRMEALGWVAMWLASDVPDDAPAKLAKCVASATSSALLVVDYAEGRQELLLQLLEAALAWGKALEISAVPPRRLHVLCLARDCEWWPNFVGATSDLNALLRGPANLGSEELPAWPSDEALRREAYLSALTDFAQAQRCTVPIHPWMPQLQSATFDRPLYIHLAALAALAGERPGHADALLGVQIAREYRFWRTERAGEVPYATWADVMAWLGLRQAAEPKALVPILSALNVTKDGFATALQRAYSDPSGLLRAIEPDLLSEGLIIERLGGLHGRALVSLALGGKDGPSAATMDVLTRLGSRGTSIIADEVPPWHLPIIDGLATTWLTHGQVLLDACHRLGHGLTLWVAAAWRRLDTATQNELAKQLRLPIYSTPLLHLLVEIERADLRTTSSSEGRAVALNNLSVRLSDLNDAASHTEALTHTREAVLILRELARVEPASNRSDLAMSLNNLAVYLYKQGDPDSRKEAIGFIREAVQIRRELAQCGSATSRENLAMSLTNLATQLSAPGDPGSIKEAIECAGEAVQIRRELAQVQPSRYRPKLALSLMSLANRLADQGDAESRTKVVECAREAVQIYREVARGQPTVYREELASSLHNLGVQLAEQVGQMAKDESLEFIQEAVQIRRELAHAQQAAYQPGLAMSLTSLANRLSGDEAVKVAREAVQIRRELAKAQPAA